MDGTPGLLSGTFAGRYTIERELGRGATATVYLARDSIRGHAVAIKVLRPELAESLGAERFLKEIRVNERLHHPHISAVLDSGEYEGRLYFVLPHMEGGSLRQMLEREKQLPIEAAVSITRTIALALDYAHRQGLIHRDVKPENILFTSGQACLADFGIARAIERAIDETTTSTGLVRGTPAYMSPEQASGNTNYDGRSDQYSLACVLYEMLAGVPAFIGPTPEAIIAMRFQHAPRDVRVYRGTVSPALEVVINRALSLIPADRYDTIGDFASALDGALRAPLIEPRTSGPSMGAARPRRWAFLGAGAVAVAAVVSVSWGVRGFTRGDIAPDTSAYLVLPVEAGDGGADASRENDALLQSLSRWKGVTIVDPFTARNALGVDTGAVSERRALRAARTARAGRYIRARLARSAAGRSMYGVVFDATDGARVHEASVMLPISAPGVDSAIAALADQLLLHAASPPVASQTRVLPALQLYAAAMQAREAFNLRRADSLLLAALEADHDFAAAALALAEVRAWREEPAATWLPWAARARTAQRLDATDRELAAAIVQMGGNSDRPCDAYRVITARRGHDIRAWYGLATCLRRDNVVLPDAGSPSGWRFRSSHHEAVRAYVRAFALAPALHRTFQPGGYERLRRLLYTGSKMLRAGVAATADSARFFAYATWNEDSLAFVPYPVALVASGATPDIRLRELAVLKQRDVFREVARTWAVALPNNPATKEVVAISLESFGDARALDTLRVARALAVDPDHKDRLAAEEIFMRVSFGRRDPAHLRSLAASADSLLRNGRAGRPELAATLTPVAALTGRCEAAGRLAASGANARGAAITRVPYRAYAAAESLTVIAAMGCSSAGDTSGFAFVSGLIRDADRDTPDSVRARLEYGVLARAAGLSSRVDSLILARLARSGGDALLAARLAFLRGAGDTAAAIVRRQIAKQSRGTAADQSPDVVYAEATLLIALHDTAGTLSLIEPVLGRTSWLELLLDRPIDAAVLVRMALLRAEIASAAHDESTAQRWGAFTSALWEGAHPGLLPEMRRLKHVVPFSMVPAAGPPPSHEVP